MENVNWIDEYIISKTNVQLQEATLEELKINKISELNSHIINELSFGYRLEDRENNEIVAFLKTKIEGKHHDTDETLLEIDCVYRGVFKTQSVINDEEFKKFVEMQAVPQLVPYVRALLTSLSAQMGIIPIVLPTMDIIESLKENANILAREDIHDGKY